MSYVTIHYLKKGRFAKHSFLSDSDFDTDATVARFQSLYNVLDVVIDDMDRF